MADKDTILEELREIILWQQLNKQIIQLRDAGAAISSRQQKIMQQFCFDSKLFQRLSEEPLLDSMPLALATNFFNQTTVTLKNEKWTLCLQKFFEDVCILDLELALADAFDVVGEYTKKFDLTESQGLDDTDDDDELYEVINQYNELLENQGRDFPGLLNTLYEIKGAAFARFIEQLGPKPQLVKDGSLFLIDFSAHPDNDLLGTLYQDEFCEKALKTMEHLTNATGALKDMDLFGFFDHIRSQPAVKRSISEFIEHERNLHERLLPMIQSFAAKLRSWPATRGVKRAIICDTSPFAILQQPFPQV